MKNKRKYKSLESKAKAQEKRLLSVAKVFKKELETKKTEWEEKVEAALISLKIEYDFQHVFTNPRSFYIVDFYLPKENVVIEVDGMHHLEKERFQHDQIRDATLRGTNGVKKVIRILNKETNCNFPKLKRLIESRIYD